MKRLLLASLLLATLPAFGQTTRASSLDWMTGTWVMDKPGEKVTESWIGPTSGTLVGVNLSQWPDRLTFEFLRISDLPDGMIYYASPIGGKPVEFKFKEASDKRVVFENKEHDFPQRIMYWREGDVLAARVEGDVQGRLRSQEWRFTSQEQ
jgi:hypothetical protein